VQFLIKPRISDASSIQEMFETLKVGIGDLVVTNEYVLSPALHGAACPCDVLYQEKYGAGEPSDEMIDPMLAAIGGKNYKRVIAIGGGTVIDIAKLFVFENCSSVAEMFKNPAALKKVRELVIVPTTCGTGSEVTCLSIVGFHKLGTKMGLGLPSMFADEVVLIDSLLKTLPFSVFATSSIDALIHAVESYVSPKANAFTKLFGKAAIERIVKGYRKIASMKDRSEIPDLKDFAFASTFAGVAFGNAGVGAVHALSYPLGGTYHVPHGKANYMVFSAVFGMYKEKGAKLDEVEAVLAEALSCGAGAVWGKLTELIDRVYPNTPIGTLGITAGMCPAIAKSVIETQQRLLVNNPVALSADDITRIYERCL